VHKVERRSTLEVFEGFRKECEQEFSKRLKVVGKFRRIFNLRGVEGRQEAKYFESLKESIVTRDRRRTSSAERRYLV
jgi:hypothetical protein